MDGWIFPHLAKSFCCLDLLALKITSPAETWLPFSHFAISVDFDNFTIISIVSLLVVCLSNNISWFLFK